jgi:hypothetical protein
MKIGPLPFVALRFRLPKAVLNLETGLGTDGGYAMAGGLTARIKSIAIAARLLATTQALLVCDSYRSSSKCTQGSGAIS